jgi:predicted nucleic acid-binding protein
LPIWTTSTASESSRLERGPIVCNAGPLIALASVAQLEFLPALYRHIVVPDLVIAEIVQSGAGRAGAIEVGSASWMEVKASGRETDRFSSPSWALERAQSSAPPCTFARRSC